MPKPVTVASTASVRWFRSHQALIRACVVAGVVLALYGRALQFGFTGDDPSGHFRFIEGTPWTAWFTDTPGFFVRPLVFVAYRLQWLIFGGYSAPGFHLVVLGLHVANAVLLGGLAATLSRRQSVGWLAALLFAAYPLSHEVATAVDTLAHALVTFWCLLALYIHSQRSGRTLQRLAVGLIVLLALLTHENGLILVPLLLAMDLLWCPPRSIREFLREPALPYAVLPALYLMWWLRIPKSTIPAPHTLGEVLQNIPYFLQTAVYPFLPVVRPAPGQPGWLVLLAAGSLLLTGLAARLLRTVRLWLFAVIWLVLAAAPSVVSLSAEYLHGAPHVYYLASVPVALLWALPPAAIAILWRGSRRAISVAFAAALALAIFLPPIPFIECEVDLYERGAELVRMVSNEAAAQPPDRSLVFINLPIFFTSTPEHPQGCPDTYAFVGKGAGAFLDYVDIRDFIRVNRGVQREARGFAVADYPPAWPPRYGTPLGADGVRTLLTGNQVYVFDPAAWTLDDLSASWQPSAAPQPRPLAIFGDMLALEGADVQQDGKGLKVSLLWRLNSLPARPVTAFVHLYNRRGELIAQHDAAPGAGGITGKYVPASKWQAGDRITDRHTIDLATPLPEDGYTIVAGLYDSQTVERLPAFTPEGRPLPDNVYVAASPD